MDASDEVDRQAGDDEMEAAEVIGVSSGTPSPPARRTPRRCVQKKLKFYLSSRGDASDLLEDGGEGYKGSSSSEGEEKMKPRRKARAGAAKKVPVTCKDPGFNTSNKNSSLTVGKGSDFFLKVSEKKLKQKRQIEQEDDFMKSKVDGGKMCNETTGMQKTHLHSSKSPLSCHPKGLPTKWWLKSGKSSTKDHRLEDLDEHPSAIDLSQNEMGGGVSSEGMRIIHPFFSRQRTKKAFESSLILKSINRNYPNPEDYPLSSYPPIHVSVMLQDGLSSLNWGRWEFYEKSLLNLSEYVVREGSFLPNSDASIGPLKLDNIIPSLNVCGDVHSDELRGQATDWATRSEDASTLFIDIRESSSEPSLSFEMSKDKEDQSFSLRSSVSVDKVENELKDGLTNESMISYQLLHSTEGHQWTNKHKPKRAAEVCGNIEAVKFLVEWLASWQQRYSGASESSICINEDINENVSESEDDSYVDSDSENGDEHPLRNVLVVIGPVGCGKTAAIYASAKELGFNVIEVNASEARNGAHIKQKFGVAMDSLGIELCSAADPTNLNQKHGRSSMESSTIQEGLKQPSLVCKSSSKKQSSMCRVANRNLFLIEDVDVIFHEDRGFAAIIMQLAEKSKRPIILTTNSNDPNLLRALDKQVVAFARPSTEDLLACLRLVCSAERANVSPKLLEQLIITCQGDIRKTILLLQFWCQGEKDLPERSKQLMYSPLQFDLDAAHWAMEKVLPWAIPCTITLRIEEEISQTISSLGENKGIIQPLTIKVNTPRDSDGGFSEALGSPDGRSSDYHAHAMHSPHQISPCSKLMVGETTSCSHVCDTYNSFCPETQMTNTDGLLSDEVNSLHFSSYENKTTLITDEETRMNFVTVDEVSDESDDRNKEYQETGSSRPAYQIMDECSHVGFSTTPHLFAHSVDQKWKGLRSGLEDLRLHLSSDLEDALRILDLTSCLTCLISNADILLAQCRPITCDVMDPWETPHDEPCSGSWHDEHLEMASTFSQHGLCLYAGHAKTLSPNLHDENPIHLAREMLAASTCSMALGKLLSQKNTICVVHGERRFQEKASREMRSNLCNAVQPVIPARLQMMLHSHALHEYTSSLSFMSKAEKSRLSTRTDRSRPHRRAQARHYLSSLSMALSPEEVELFAGYGCFGSLDFRYNFG